LLSDDQARSTGRVDSPSFSAAIADDGTLAAISCLRRAEARIWDLARGKEIGTIPLRVKGHVASVLAISPDNRILASASIGGREESPEHDTILLSDLRNGQLLKKISRPPNDRVKSLAFSSDGRRLIAGLSDGTCLGWDISKL
jgi:WD40 repeat protein